MNLFVTQTFSDGLKFFSFIFLISIPILEQASNIGINRHSKSCFI